MKVSLINYNYNKNIPFQSRRQGWDNLKALLAEPDGAKWGRHPVSYEYKEAIAETNILPTFNKDHFTYTDYKNLSPKERRVIGILNRKGTFKYDNIEYTRDNMSIDRDAERILRIAVKTKEKLDKVYENGYKLVGIGRSPAAIVETMNLLGADAVAIPFSKGVFSSHKFPFSYEKKINKELNFYTQENFEIKDWENYFKYFGIDNSFSERTGKKLIFTDHVCAGGTKHCLESILNGLGFDDKKTKFLDICLLIPKDWLLPDDYASKVRCFDNRVFDVYGKIERLAFFISDINIIKHPELIPSLPETFMSKLFRCALYNLIAEKKFKNISIKL